MNPLGTRSTLFWFCTIVARQAPLVRAHAGFQREECYGRVAEILRNASSSNAMNPSYIISNSDPENPVLSLDGCKQLCGSGTGWYPDSGPRLIAWLLPILLLVSNLQFAPIGMERFLMIVHLFGDPIDSTWSLLEKAKSWSQCTRQAQKLLKVHMDVRNLAVILASADEMSDALAEEILLAVDRTHRVDAHKTKSVIAGTARTLRGNRKNELLRTVGAVAMYAFQVVAAFVPKIGAASSPSGGRIAVAMLISWLVAIVLLSNIIGTFGDWQNCQEVLGQLMDRLGQHANQDLYFPSFSVLALPFVGLNWKTQTSHLTSRAWSGAIYSYRPSKPFRHASGWKSAFLAVLPGGIAFGTAFAVLDDAHLYFNCRHIFVITVVGFWILSAALTSLLSWTNLITGKYLWYIVLVKDAFIAIPTLSLSIASSCGLWNTCYCKSGALTFGESEARVPLNPIKVYGRNNGIRYPATVATGLSLQVCVFGTMLWVAWPGFRTMWWNDKEKRAAKDLGR